MKFQGKQLTSLRVAGKIYFAEFEFLTDFQIQEF